MDEIEFLFATLSYKPPIVLVTIKSKATLDVKEICSIMNGCEKITRKRPFVVLIDARRKITGTGNSIKSIIESEDNSLIKAGAVLVKKHGQMLAANVFLIKHEPPFRVKVSRDKRKAVKWLKIQAERKGIVNNH